MIDLGKGEVLGVGISAVDYDAAVEQIIAAAAAGRAMTVSATSVHGVLLGALDHEHRRRLNAFDLLVPDGQPVRWALRWLHGKRLAERVYGPELMNRLCRAAAEAGLPIYLYGGAPGVTELLVRRLAERFASLKIAGSQSPPFAPLSAEEDAAVVRQIRESGARLLFIGLGCPKQDIFADEHRAALGLPQICVGAAFDFHAGVKRTAPRWMQQRGLEWLFRLAQEPRRLWRRYLLWNPLYVVLLAAQWLGLWSFGDRPAAPAAPPQPRRG